MGAMSKLQMGEPINFPPENGLSARMVERSLRMRGALRSILRSSTQQRICKRSTLKKFSECYMHRVAIDERPRAVLTSLQPLRFEYSPILWSGLGAYAPVDIGSPSNPRTRVRISAMFTQVQSVYTRARGDAGLPTPQA